MSGLERIINAKVNKDGTPSLEKYRKDNSPEAVRKENEEQKK